MTVTYTPATNRYAFIAALVATPPSRKPPRPRPFELTTVEREVLAATEPRPTRRCPSSNEYTHLKAAILGDYAAAFPSVVDRHAHRVLLERLAEQHAVPLGYVCNITKNWRDARNVRVPTYGVKDCLRPGEIALLRTLAAAGGAVPVGDLAARLNVTAVKRVSTLVGRTRHRLARLSGDPAAGGVIVTLEGPLRYRLDAALAARYPHLLAALEDGTP